MPVSRPRVCAVVPAAGLGSRLGPQHQGPKILVEVVAGVTVWHLLHRSLAPWVDHVHVVVSPTGQAAFCELAGEDIARGAVSVSVQDEPRGMGDAIFGATEHWVGFDTILVVWGDQVHLSSETVGRVLGSHHGDLPAAIGAEGGAAAARAPRLTLPLVALPDPYVEYEIAPADVLRHVRQSREGERCRPGGLSDVGVFCLSAAGLPVAWSDYLRSAPRGTSTGEVNFLPFLPHLSRARGWRVDVVTVEDPLEASGINTPADLELARAVLR